MAGEDKAVKFITRYRSIFIFLGFILIAQILLATRLILIAENDLSSRKNQHPSIPGRQHHSDMDAQNRHSEVDPSELRSLDTAFYEKPIGADVVNFNVHTPSHAFSKHKKPSCGVTGKEAVSAIRRAKTDYCKEYLANITCEISAHNLYPKRLPRFCKRNDLTYMKRVGCFHDDKDSRLLGDHYVLLKETNSPQNCVDTCLQSGFPYAGVQYSVECFCGKMRPSTPAIDDPAACGMKCPYAVGDNINSQSTCGGYFVIDVYETGVSRDDEVHSSVLDLQNASKELIAEASVNGTARVVFLITLNGRALRQVTRLIKALFHERHYFYIHVDARQDYMFRELLALSSKIPDNIRFLRDRKSTIWGGASLLKVLLQVMKELVDNPMDWKWDYVINLSESDFPLKTVSQLEAFLTLNRGKNFLKSHGREVQNFISKQGLDKTFVECEYRMWRIGDRKLPAGILMDGGSDWIGLHYGFVKYIVTTDDDLVNGLLKLFYHTLLPAEVRMTKKELIRKSN